jgi:phosphoribosyl 1,2-cyclic phosphodiesterase
MMRMSLSVTSLASGSNGNAFLVQAGPQTLLVEAGLSVRTLERHMRQRGIDPAALSAIVVSHEHHDHAQSAGPLARRYGVPLISSAGTAGKMQLDWAGLDLRQLDQTGITIGNVYLWGFPLPHDAAEPLGIVLAYEGCKVGWALDLGHVPDHVATWLEDAELVIVESNHERAKLFRSAYPYPLKLRIASPYGHLCNEDAVALLLKLGQDGRKRAVWLAHLSENTNDRPNNVLKYFRNVLDMAGIKCLSLEIAERSRPSATWPALQQPLFESI